MTPFLGELVGTAVLVYFGETVNANVTFKTSKGFNSGWVIIALGWAFAVAIPVLMFGLASGAHFNPAVTLGLAAIGLHAGDQVLPYIVAQFLGAMIGSTLVWIHFKPHFDAEDQPGNKLGVFATGPAIRGYGFNVVSEFLGTFALVFTILGIGASFPNGDGAAIGVKALSVGGIILVIGCGVGGVTGYAINPARDLGPRIMHALLPIKGKGGSDWGYAWVPVVAPVLGGIAAALVARALGMA